MHLGEPITSRSNARVKALRASLSGQARQPGDLLGLEGPNLVHEAHMWGLSFDTVYIREGNEEFLGGRGWPSAIRAAHWAVLSRDVFDSVLSTASPQGIAATWVIEDPKPLSPRTTTGLVLENIQDPGNLGTLIRSAAAFGMGDVMVTPDCVNHWNPKVVRSAAGALFRTRVRRLPLSQIAEELRTKGVRLFAAVSGFAHGGALSAPHGVLFGRRPNATASGVAHRDESGKPVGSSTGVAQSLSYDADFEEPCAVMIGNEGAGLSNKARRFADEQVLIPCSVESLNAAVAGSVLMYEVMRQRALRIWARKQGLRP